MRIDMELPFVVVLFCAVSFVVPASSVALPSPTPLYYSVVSAGFGPLGFSLHYEEYGNATNNQTLSVSRYYSPRAVETTDFNNNVYLLQYPDPTFTYYSCTIYPLSSIVNSRMLQGATALLVEMVEDNVPFNYIGITSPQIRGQTSRHYSAALAWNSNSVSNTYSFVDAFIKQAYATAGMSLTSTYSISLAIDVYYLSDQSGNLLTAGGGNIPLQYTLVGQYFDNSGVSHAINILYDFMQFSTLDTRTAQYSFLIPIASCSKQNTTLPPPLPSTFALLPINTTLPSFSEGRVTLEITASNHATVQYTALLRSSHGQEMLITMVDPANYIWDSSLYTYDFADERDYAFANGAIYTLNQTDADPYYTRSDESLIGYQLCTSQKISPGNISPLQWLDAGQLHTFFADQTDFLAGAVSTTRQTIRGVSVDAWSVPTKTAVYNGVHYNYTLQVYVTSNGWVNLGRINANMAPQLMRLLYSGVATNAKGVQTSYWLQMDFFLQYPQPYESQTHTFDPHRYGCETVPLNQAILPPLPNQFSVSVSEAWLDVSFSSQYTVYYDKDKNLKRIDGRFTPPNTFSLIGQSPYNKNFITLLQWTQNVTLNSGFSSLSINSDNIPYTHFTANEQEIPCSQDTLPITLYANSASLSFFEFLAQADPSQAIFIDTISKRGVDVDEYELSMFIFREDGVIQLITFILYYLSVDETKLNDILVSAIAYTYDVDQHLDGRNIIQYNFFNFRSGVPKNLLAGPAPSSCVADPILPTSIPDNIYYLYYTDFDPAVDGTPTIAPTWPAAFSMIIEGKIFQSIGDNNVYIARWYTDFNNFRERLDIEPAFNMSAVNGIQPITKTYLYYYNKDAGNTLSFTSGQYVEYTGSTCAPTAITSSNMNPLKQIAPGNLFDTFFPTTTNTLSKQSSYNIYARFEYRQYSGFFYDEYDWNTTTNFAGNSYALQSSIFVSIIEWVNNIQAGNYSNSRIPLALQATGNIYSKSGQIVSNYNPQFTLTHYQAVNPGPAYFDAALLGCITTPSSPWYNIYGDNSMSSSSSNSSSTVIGAVVGVIGGILFLAFFSFLAYRWWKRSGSNTANKFSGGIRSRGKDNENELVGVGKVASDDGPELSLNRASLNNLVKEGNVDLEAGEITASASNETVEPTAAPKSS